MQIEDKVDRLLIWLEDRARRMSFAKAVDDTKEIWEPLGFHVHVDSNRQRITVVRGIDDKV